MILALLLTSGLHKIQQKREECKIVDAMYVCLQPDYANVGINYVPVPIWIAGEVMCALQLFFEAQNKFLTAHELGYKATIRN